MNLRETIEDLSPDMSLPEQELLAGQVTDCIEKYGLLRVCTIGEIVGKMIASTLEEERDRSWSH